MKIENARGLKKLKKIRLQKDTKRGENTESVGMFSLESFGGFKIIWGFGVKKYGGIGLENRERIRGEGAIAKKDNFRFHRGRAVGYF